MLAAVLVGTGSDLAALALTASAAWMITRASQHPGIAALGIAIVGVRAFALSRGVLRYGERLLSHDVALRSLSRLRGRVYEALIRHPDAGSVRQAREADLQERLVRDADVAQDLLLRCVIPALTAMLTALAAVLFTALELPTAGVLLAASAVVAATLAPFLAATRAARIARRTANSRVRFLVDAYDLIVGAADLAAAGADGRALSRAQRSAAGLGRLERAGEAVGPAAFLLALQGLTSLGVAAVAAQACRDGRLPAVWVPVLALTALAAFEVLKPLVPAARWAVTARPSVHRLAELLDGPTQLPVDRVPSARCPGATGQVWELHGLTVRHRERGEPALDGVDLRLTPGRPVALVGLSGAGKSTVLAALAGRVSPAQGSVTLGGADLSRCDPDEVRSHISGLFQDAHLFDADIRANLLLAAPQADPEQLAAAARTAHLLDWIESLPQGWATPLGDHGARLSGGQRRRLLLARALLADRPLLLLDEPTEGLDPAQADAVMAEILAAARGRALCMATHRISGLEAFDEIVVLDAGTVVQRGTHAELVRRPGLYRDLALLENLVRPPAQIP
jgi:thiol reductant ABC exporter CydC subunit